MKSSFVRVATFAMFLVAILLLQNCKKETKLYKVATHDNIGLANSGIIETSPYTVSTVAGNNPNSQFPTPLPYPSNICSAADGTIYVTSGSGSYDILKLTPQGSYTSFLNYGPPGPIRAGANGSLYFISNYRSLDGTIDTTALVKVERNKKVTVLNLKEKLSEALDLAIGPDSSIYIPEYNNSRIVKITKQGSMSTFAGKKGIRGFADGPADKAHLTFPSSVKFGEDGNLWVLDGALYYNGQSIRKVDMSGTVTTLFKLKYDYNNYNYISAFAVTKRDKNFKLTPYENVIFFVRTYTNGNRIRSNQLFHLSHDKVLTPLTGNFPESDNYSYKDGPALQATFNGPVGITINPRGIFVADQTGGVIRRIALK
ncbi:hypothetical protein A0256_13460 [Mucilaginibacter sp. PAMC 26640]|nr:hypothetical protein A0256_13460 [Mucilaginibacter sp. PAMC 26640]